MKNSKQDSSFAPQTSQNTQRIIFYAIVTILIILIAFLLGLNIYNAGKNNARLANSNELQANQTTNAPTVIATTTSSPTPTTPKATPKPTKKPTPKPKPVVRYAQYYGIIDKQNDTEFARYDGMHAFILQGDNKMFDSYVYIVPLKPLSSYTLTKKHIYKLRFDQSQIESKVKDDKATTYVLTGINDVDDTKLTYYWFGIYHRNAGDEWGPKYASDVFLKSTIYTDSGAIDYITFIPKMVADKLNFDIGRKYRVAFSFCEEDIKDPTIKSFICSGDAKVLEVK